PDGKAQDRRVEGIQRRGPGQGQTGLAIRRRAAGLPGTGIFPQERDQEHLRTQGLPFPGDLKWWSPMDVTGAAKDFPDLNFLVYHSGFKGLEDALPVAEDGFRKTSYIPWV